MSKGKEMTQAEKKSKSRKKTQQQLGLHQPPARPHTALALLALGLGVPLARPGAGCLPSTGPRPAAASSGCWPRGQERGGQGGLWHQAPPWSLEPAGCEPCSAGGRRRIAPGRGGLSTRCQRRPRVLLSPGGMTQKCGTEGRGGAGTTLPGDGGGGGSAECHRRPALHAKDRAAGGLWRPGSVAARRSSLSQPQACFLRSLVSGWRCDKGKVSHILLRFCFGELEPL